MVYKILFKDIIPLSYIDSLVKLYEWFGNNQNRFSKNLVSLHGILWGIDEKYTISVIEKEKRISEENVVILNRFNNARAHFLLSKYYFEVKKDFCRVEKLLAQAKAEGSEDAKDYIVDQKVIELSKKWPDIDIEYMKNHIEFLINKQEYDYPHEWTENEKKLHRFVADSLSIVTKRYNCNADAYNDARIKYFGTEGKGRDNDYSKNNKNNDLLYEQKFFVIHVIQQTMYYRRNDGREGLIKQSESYYPAKYLIDKSETNPLLDSANFRKKGYRIMIKILLQNLLEF